MYRKAYRNNGLNRRRWQVIGVAATGVVIAGIGLGVASASETPAAQTIVCPQVAGLLPAVPAQSQAEVERNLALLNTQLAEANQRLSKSAGEGGPNFVQNAILGPLKDKRVSTIDRIVISIGRHAAKPSLDEQGLATCTLSGKAGAAEPTAVATQKPGTGTGTGTAAGTTQKIVCPPVTGLPSVPAQAKDEVARNLTLLQTQIDEANQRLATSAGQGGPNFVQNAILGPLKDKRVATLNRIATAIGRNAPKPDLHVDATAGCRLQ